MIAIARYLILTSCILHFSVLNGQGINTLDTTRISADYKPEFRREFNHDAIGNEQKAILASDGIADKSFSPSNDNEINFLLTLALTKKVNIIQYLVETDSVFDHRLKVNYLKGLDNILKYYRTNWKSVTERKVNPLGLPIILNAYYNSVQQDRDNASIENIIEQLPYDAGTVIMNAGIFENNPGFKAGKNILLRKYCGLYPWQTFSTLQQNPDLPFADSLIRTVARKYPAQLYDFAAANNKLGYIIRSIQDDPFILTVSRMAKSKSGQQYFPFLDNIVKGKMSFEEIDSVKDDSLLYYKLLVKTQIDYIERTLNKDTAFEIKALTARLEKKARVFINIINGLHDESADIRFSCIQPLNAQELYYLAVSSDGSIYTSSFVKGVYPLMMKKINYHGDSLLQSVNFDKYRKFIKMAAGYNTLSNFLSSFPARRNHDNESEAENLMKTFVSKLELGNGLEDGVDVADSYASIAETIKPLAKEMLKNVQANYKRNAVAGNKRGMAIYTILNNLFLSADSTNKIDLTKELGIPPVYSVPFKSITNDSGRVIIQVFFYSDKKVQGIFKGFVNLFSNTNWKITGNEQWVCITSVKGKPISIYANKASIEENGEDEKAQKALGQYLENNELYPTITVHRGHSYTAPYTIDQMSPSSKIVFLGSCGGYQIIHDALEKAPDAHIISTKQIADAPVNLPFFQLLTDKLRKGSNIDWIPFWKELDKMITAKIFEDYIPPYKNLGALFIKAFKIAGGGE